MSPLESYPVFCVSVDLDLCHGTDVRLIATRSIRINQLVLCLPVLIGCVRFP